jgi:hypothetical protein
LQPVYFLGQNTVTLAGTVSTTSTALTTVAFWFYEIFLPGGRILNICIPFFLIFPGIFVLGLLLIPLGILIRLRSLRASGKLPKTFPAIDLRLPMVRRTFEWVALAAALNRLLSTAQPFPGPEVSHSAQYLKSDSAKLR